MYFKIQKNCRNPDALLIIKHKSVSRRKHIPKKYQSIEKINVHQKNQPLIYYSNCQQQLSNKFKSPKSYNNLKLKFNTETAQSRNSTRDFNGFDDYFKNQKNEGCNYQAKLDNKCNYDRKMEAQNKILRNQNLCLSKYCQLIQKKYQEVCKQLQKERGPQNFLTLQNQRLKRNNSGYLDSQTKTTIIQSPISPLTNLLSQRKN